MMFRPDPLHPETFSRIPVRSSYPSNRQGNPSRFLADQPSQIDELIDSLMPEGVSPNKRAVIEQLVTLWQAKSTLDIA